MPTKEETQEAILQAAQALFIRYGPIKTSVADIARELGMSPANVYNFFPSRNAILETVGERHLTTLRQRVEREIARIADPWRKIEAMFLITARSIHERLENEKDILQLQALSYREKWQFVNNYHEFLLRKTGDILVDGIKSGRMKGDKPSLNGLTPETIARAVFDSLVVCYEPGRFLEAAAAEREGRVRAQLKLLEAAFT